jgi:hypothetical protein
MNSIEPIKTKPRGHGRSINHHLCVLGADKYLPDIYLKRSDTKPRRYKTIWDRYEKYEIEFAAKKAFRESAKKAAKNNVALRKLIESNEAVLKILKYH